MQYSYPPRKTIKVIVKNMNGEVMFNDKRHFIYKLSSSFTLLETDKPIYKPGEKGYLNKFDLN